MLKSFLLIICILLAIFVTPWALIGVIILALWKWRIWYRHNGRPWRYIHFNAMILFSAAVAREELNSSDIGEAFNIRNAYVDLIYSFSHIGIFISEDPNNFIDRQIKFIGSPEDQTFIVDYLTEKKKINHATAITAVTNFFSGVDLSDSYFMIRAIIAGIIQSQYSTLDRGEYMNAVMRGKAG